MLQATMLPDEAAVAAYVDLNPVRARFGFAERPFRQNGRTLVVRGSPDPAPHDCLPRVTSTAATNHPGFPAGGSVGDRPQPRTASNAPDTSFDRSTLDPPLPSVSDTLAVRTSVTGDVSVLRNVTLRISACNAAGVAPEDNVTTSGDIPTPPVNVPITNEP
jgi:hypothetical protein